MKVFSKNIMVNNLFSQMLNQLNHKKEAMNIIRESLH